MRTSFIVLAHLLPAALFVWGDPAVALVVMMALHALILVGALVPRSQIFGKVPSITKELPTGIATENEVLLTFDDGPHPEFTPQVLDILDRHNTRAVFFLIGENAAAHPDLVKEIQRRGHHIGNHTQSHPERAFWRLLPTVLRNEIDTCQQTLTNITGAEPTLFRPPVGMHNPMLFDLLEKRNLPCIVWTHRGLDTVTPDPDRIVQRITTGLHPGAILLIHDHLPTGPEVTERVLTHLKSHGLKTVQLRSQ